MDTAVYYSHLDDRPGALATLDRALTFLDAESGEVTEVTPLHINFLTVGARVTDREDAAIVVARMRGQHEYLTACMGN